MQFQDIHLTDWHRLLIGMTPDIFLVEVLFRALITYLLLWGAMRLMGKRVAGQMSALELTIIVSLGAAIGVPLQAPERGMVPAAVILLVTIVYQRGLNFWAFKSRKAELALQGDVAAIIEDGRLNLNVMRSTVLSHERLYSTLRQDKIIHLGQVKRAYIEADGRFSIFTAKDAPPGLCILPRRDADAFGMAFCVKGRHACRNCGHVLTNDREPGPCESCGENAWAPAVQETELAKLNVESPRPSRSAAA